MEPGKKGHDHPFARADRLHFPAMTKAMWECPADDSFSTPETAGQLPHEGAAGLSGTPPPGWTPSSQDFVWLTPRRAGDGRGVDAFFSERERRGLLTPARSPGDFMRRGSLFDPCATGSSSHSSQRARSASELGLTPGSVSDVCTPTELAASSSQGRATSSCLRDGRDASTSGSCLAGARGQDARSPATRGVRFSPELSASAIRQARVCSGKQRIIEAQRRISITPIEERSPTGSSNWSVSPVASPEGPRSQSANVAELCELAGMVAAASSATSTCVVPAPFVGIASTCAMHQSSSTAGTTRENDSLSVSINDSISFGKDDARMRASETRDLVGAPVAAGPSDVTVVCQTAGGQANMPPEMPNAARAGSEVYPKSHSSNGARAETRESVARQLDFDADGTPLRPSLRALRQPAAIPSSPVARMTAARQRELGATGTPGTPASDWEPVDWDSSLSREVVPTRHANIGTWGNVSTNTSIASPSLATTLRELSPLRSEGGCSPGPAAFFQYPPLKQVRSDDECDECPHCGRSSPSLLMPIEASALADGRSLPVSIERVNSSNQSILVQLRLGTRVDDRQQNARTLDCPRMADIASRSPARSRHRKDLSLTPEKGEAPHSRLTTSFVEPLLSRSSWFGLPSLDEGPAGYQGSAAALQCEPSCSIPRSSGWPRQRRPGSADAKASQPKHLGRLVLSTEELNGAVEALRQRYLQHYFKAKPLCNITSLGRCASESQLLRCRRRLVGSGGGPRLRSGRARSGSRLRSS